jgi:glucuronosyltransferase
LFISHGGLLGVNEAIYEGVPIMGIPIFVDQRHNLKNLEERGVAELLEYSEISTEWVLSVDTITYLALLRSYVVYLNNMM